MKIQSFLSVIINIFLLSVAINCVNAQEAPPPPVEWGNIPRADLEMKTFPKDTNASALILCDYGESRFNDEFEIVFNRHLRIKILTTKGYEWGTYSLSIYTKDHTERISDIEGVTYWLNENGTIENSKLNENDIIEEEANEKYTRYKFTLPNLKPGCVIEIRYKITTQNIALIKDWVFQCSEPVRWSEYRIIHPKMMGYTIVPHGYHEFAIRETKDLKQVFYGKALRYVGVNRAE